MKLIFKTLKSNALLVSLAGVLAVTTSPVYAQGNSAYCVQGGKFAGATQEAKDAGASRSTMLDRAAVMSGGKNSDAYWFMEMVVDYVYDNSFSSKYDADRRFKNYCTQALGK